MHAESDSTAANRGKQITPAEIHAAAQDPVKTLQLIKRICGGAIDAPAVFRALAMAEMQAVADEAWANWNPNR